MAVLGHREWTFEMHEEHSILKHCNGPFCTQAAYIIAALRGWKCTAKNNDEPVSKSNWYNFALLHFELVCFILPWQYLQAPVVFIFLWKPVASGLSIGSRLWTWRSHPVLDTKVHPTQGEYMH